MQGMLQPVTPMGMSTLRKADRGDGRRARRAGRDRRHRRAPLRRPDRPGARQVHPQAAGQADGGGLRPAGSGGDASTSWPTPRFAPEPGGGTATPAAGRAPRRLRTAGAGGGRDHARAGPARRGAAADVRARSSSCGWRRPRRTTCAPPPTGCASCRRRTPTDGADEIIWPIVAGMLAAALPAGLLKGVAGAGRDPHRAGRDAAQRHHRDGPGAVAARRGRRRAPRAAARHPAGRAGRSLPARRRCRRSAWRRSWTSTAIAASPRSISACRAGRRTPRRSSPRSPTTCGSPTRSRPPTGGSQRAAATAEATLRRARRAGPAAPAGARPDRRCSCCAGPGRWPACGRPASSPGSTGCGRCAGNCCSSAPTWPAPGCWSSRTTSCS